MDPHEIAASAWQGGAFTGRQARAQQRWEHIRQWQAAGLVVRDSRSVFRLPDAPDDIANRVARTELRTGRQLIASHHTAAQLAGFGVLASDLLHVMTPDARSLKAPPGIAIHQVALRSPAICIGGSGAQRRRIPLLTLRRRPTLWTFLQSLMQPSGRE